ncbi:SAM-dependent methyltransferase [Acidithiobacillus marinus]|uniref:SAM-dependent methyltransferase n=2 Tax=Acidithiobacillus marinus TaxID=187490 RepID=A0A2I1DMA4_9PROT|nr:SAM-dependent methyltransferase [Acidithiobacillus marinus]
MQDQMAAPGRQISGDSGTNPAGSASDQNHFFRCFQEDSMRIERPDFLTYSRGGRKVELPVPDDAAQAHSARLLERIRAAIAEAGGVIAFRHYMDMALYTPGLGYYMAGQNRLGADGDFVTAPEMGAVLARVLVRVLAEVLATVANSDGILEFGAGRGTLAQQIHQCLPEQPYAILELSPDLQEQQRSALPNLRHLQQLPNRWRGVMLANEVLDAMPVQVVERDAGGLLRERGVCWDGEKLDWDWMPGNYALDDRLKPLLEQCPANYRTEMHPLAIAWLREVATCLQAGALILIDYGQEAGEYYHPQRQSGSLRAYYRQHWLDDPFYWPGLCDLTAHVNFSALLEAAPELGLEVQFYGNLARFLVEHGLAEAYAGLAAGLDAPGLLALNNEIKRLTLPQEMGESFKVLILCKRETA